MASGEVGDDEVEREVGVVAGGDVGDVVELALDVERERAEEPLGDGRSAGPAGAQPEVAVPIEEHLQRAGVGMVARAACLQTVEPRRPLAHLGLVHAAEGRIVQEEGVAVPRAGGVVPRVELVPPHDDGVQVRRGAAVGVDDALQPDEGDQVTVVVDLGVAALAELQASELAALDVVEELPEKLREQLRGRLNLRQKALHPPLGEERDDGVAADDHLAR